MIWVAIYVACGAVYVYANSRSKFYRAAEEAYDAMESTRRRNFRIGMFIGAGLGIALWPLMVTAFVAIIIAKRLSGGGS